MVSIESYRARIGMFNRAGKSKQGPVKSFDESLIYNETLQPGRFQQLKLCRKLIFICFLIQLVLMGGLFFNQISETIPDGGKL